MKYNKIIELYYKSKDEVEEKIAIFSQITPGNVVYQSAIEHSKKQAEKGQDW